MGGYAQGSKDRLDEEEFKSQLKGLLTSSAAGGRPPLWAVREHKLKQKKAGFKACLLMNENYNCATNRVPAKRSISILCKGPSCCAALVNAFITPNRDSIGSVR